MNLGRGLDRRSEGPLERLCRPALFDVRHSTRLGSTAGRRLAQPIGQGEDRLAGRHFELLAH